MFDKKFIEQLYYSSNTSDFNCNLHVKEKENYKKFYYIGYPTGNYLKIISKCIELWAIERDFPIIFNDLNGIEVSFYLNIL